MILRFRIASLICVHILILLHVYYFGSDRIGSVDFQEFFHSFLKLGIVNAGVILVFLAFLTTLLFGRFFCGWACHFGAIQELSYYILKKFKVNIKTIDSNLVTILPFLILLNYYVIPNVYHSFMFPWDKIQVSLNEPEIWEFLPGFIIGSLTFLVDGFIIVYFLGKKGFCRFLCPWGAFLKFPNSLAFFKVRKTGNCTQCHVCTTECPVGIDVSYEINNYNKVTNTNCTSCLNCTYGCPSNALSYTYENPLKENFELKHYMYNKNIFKHNHIVNQFKSIRNKEIYLLLLLIIISLSIDGLYGIGHFLAYGIGLITAFILLFSIKESIKPIKILIMSTISIFVIWHGLIKYSIWQGYHSYDNQQYTKSITHLKRAVYLYPKKIGKMHMRLAEMYLIQDDSKRALKHALIAQDINPNHKSPKELIELIRSK